MNGSLPMMLMSSKKQPKRKPSRQPVEEVINAAESGPQFEAAPEWNFPDQSEPAQGKTSDEKSFAMEEFGVEGGVSSSPLSDDISKMRELESEKQDLQRRLNDARGALDDYTSKLSSQVNLWLFLFYARFLKTTSGLNKVKLEKKFSIRPYLRRALPCPLSRDVGSISS